MYLKNGLHLFAGQKAKKVLFFKGDSVSVGVGAAPKKILADITNMEQQLQQKHQPATDVSIDLILKVIYNVTVLLLLLIDDYHYIHGYFEFTSQENATMRKLLESYKVEYQKYQTNFQKLRKQNSEFALANTQMMRVLTIVILICLILLIDCWYSNLQLLFCIDLIYLYAMQEINSSRQMVSLEHLWCIDTCCFHFLFFCFV